MKNVLYLVFALLFFQCPAQNSEVQFLEHITGNKIDFMVVNSSSFPQEVNLQVTSAKGLRGNRKPVVKTIAPKDTLQFYSFIITGAYSYLYDIQAKPIIEIADYSEKLDVDTENGIVVFFKADCPRSTRTVAYLTENKKDFKVVDIKASQENRAFMYQVLKEKRIQYKDLLMPVVLVDGSLFYNFDIPVAFQKMFD